MANIQKRGDTYRIRCSCGYDSYGKQITKSKTWQPTPEMTPKQIEKELERQAFLFEEKCRNGQVLDSTIKFSDYIDIWLIKYAEPNLRKTTLARYKDLLKRLIPALGHIRLEKLQPHHLQEFYNNLAEDGIREDTKYKANENFAEYTKGITQIELSTMAGVAIQVIYSCNGGRNVMHKSAQAIADALNVPVAKIFDQCESKPLADKTILHYHRLISSILTNAVYDQILFSNPCDRVRSPKIHEKKEAKYLDEVDTARMLTLVDKEPHPYDVIVKLLVFTGLRRGELCGLNWTDIDFLKKLINVQRSSLYLPEEGVFEDTTKNFSSKRVFKVSDEVIDILTEYKHWQEEQAKALGTQWHQSERIITSYNGVPIHPDTVSSWFAKFINKNKLPDISIHSLRHTNATLMIAGGTPVATVSKRLGHANITTTSDIYAHAIRSADEAAANTLQDILSPDKNRKAR